MKYQRETTVMYADTDSYQVVWHGNYLRWLEEGRFSLCKKIGIDVGETDKNGLIFPIVDMHIKYKSPAKIFEEIIIETGISEVKSRTVTFYQTVKNKKSGTLHVTAEVVCTTVNTFENRLQKIPENMFNAFKNAIE